MDNSPDEFQEGMPVQVTVLGSRESREVVKVGDTYAVGPTSSWLMLAFPQTNKDIPAKTFIVEVPSEVVEEYSECSYDLYREAHPEAGLPERTPGAPLTPIVIAK